MANPEHIAILRQGVESWNKWRKENPTIRPDIGDEDLIGISLSSAQLNDVRLSGTRLSNATLRGANLRDANLSGTNLSHADLSKAQLIDAYLLDANCRRANLRGADLKGARLIRTNLLEADLTDTFFFETAITDCPTLQDATGLETISHLYPSAIDSRTLRACISSLPDVFLQGVGFADVEIDYLRALYKDASIQFYSCFISYSSKDQAFAERLHADLQSKGVRCWFAPEDMKIGDRFRVRIDESIRVHEKLLLILSENSVASDWVEKEVETAMEKERESRKPVLFPVRLDDSANAIKSGWAADVRRTRHIGDFSKWKLHDEYEKAFERLLRDLKIE